MVAVELIPGSGFRAKREAHVAFVFNRDDCIGFLTDAINGALSDGCRAHGTGE